MQAGTHHIGNVNKAVQDVTIRGDGCAITGAVTADAVTRAPCCPAELVFDLAKTMPMLAGGANGLDTITPATKTIATDIAGKKVLPALFEPHGAQARRFRVVLLAGLPMLAAPRLPCWPGYPWPKLIELAGLVLTRNRPMFFSVAGPVAEPSR